MMIKNYRFGKITINGTLYTSDLKIIDNTVIPDWWRKEGHNVTISDITDILEKKPDILVIGTGESGRMRISETLKKKLAENHITLIEEDTGKAAATINRLTEEKKNFSAGLHLTC